MKLFSVPRNFTSLALTACCAIGVSSALAQTYIVTDLGTLPGQKSGVSTPAAINDQKKGDEVQVAGTSGTSAFRYTSRKNGRAGMQDLGANPPGSISRGFGINGPGMVVGDSTFGSKQTRHAAIFSNGSATDLGTLQNGGPFSRANGINAFGLVVGSSGETLDSDKSRAFIKAMLSPSSGMTDLGTLGGLYAQALAINDSGFVTGNSQTTDELGSAGPTHAFIWQAQTGMLDLGTIDGNYSYGTAINANNHVVGYSTINNFDDRLHAFLYNGKQMLDLGSLGGASVDGDFSFALGVNSADQVVGYSYLPFEQGNVPLGPWAVAFIYSQGLMVNLNDRIGAATENYRLDSATAINNNGQIVAVAFNKSADAYHAVLLTPSSIIGPAPDPEPTPEP